MKELKKTLKNMMEEISKESKPNIQEYMQRIDEIKEDLGDEIHPMLRHYLERHSYEKALNFLETRE